jgi:hypothetical protein
MGVGKIVPIPMEAILVARPYQLPSERFRKALGSNIIFENGAYVF